MVAGCGARGVGGGVTDLEKFVDLYASIGVPLTPEPVEHPYTDDVFRGARQMLVLNTSNYDGDKTPKVDGYSGFYTRIFFDQEGAFVAQGIWE